MGDYLEFPDILQEVRGAMVNFSLNYRPVSVMLSRNLLPLIQVIERPQSLLSWQLIQKYCLTCFVIIC